MPVFPLPARPVRGWYFAVAAAGLALAACAGTGVPAGGQKRATGSVPPASPRASATPSGASGVHGRHGELAYVAHGRLFLLGGAAGTTRRMHLPGAAFAPAWSADHHWLAVEVTKPPPAGSPPYQHGQGPTALWLADAAGAHARRLTPASWDITSFAWSPRVGQLVVAARVEGAKPARAAAVATFTPAGDRAILATGSYVSGVSWSPGGHQVAAGLSTFSRRGGWRGTLQVLDSAGGRPRVVTASAGNVLDLAGWWPDGSGLLYWFDPQGSASLAADGLPLDTVSLATGRSRRLVPSMLAHGSWLAFSPDGHTAAVVAGGDRGIWGGRKHIEICRSSGRCVPAGGSMAGVVGLQPSWSPGGTEVAFTRAPASGRFGPTGHAEFSPSWLRRWQAASRIWAVPAGGTHPRGHAATAPGAAGPVWGSDGSVLFVRADWLWLLPPHAAAPIRLAGPLGALAAPAYGHSYFGYIPYPQLIAWTGARPLSTAGNS